MEGSKRAYKDFIEANKCFWRGFNLTVIFLSLAFIVGTYQIVGAGGGGDLEEMIETCIEDNTKLIDDFKAEFGDDESSWNAE